MLFPFLLLTLAGSLVVNVLLYRHASESYRQVSKVQLDPLGLQHVFPKDVAAARASLPTILFFGDSRAEKWPAPPLNDYHYVNRGIGGQTTAQIRARFSAHVMPISPQIVILQAGVNDLKAIGLFPERRDAIVADCKANLRDIVARAVAGGAAVIVTTIFPPGEITLDRRLIWSPLIEAAIEEVNADLRSLATEHVLVLDAWKLLEDRGKLKEGLGIDTLHLNSKGYDLLNAALEKTLQSLGREKSAP